jgi:luciferase family oxidoreductase group 1
MGQGGTGRTLFFKAPIPMIPFSVLDLAPVPQGADVSQAFRNSLSLAQKAEALGFHRFWLAEHHNMPGIASAATAVVIGHVAAGTKRIRVGSGGIMLPNHAPLMVAEQFGTLEALFPGRIDLGLGRAPGTDQRTMRALRRNLDAHGDSFPQDVVELLAYFEPMRSDQAVRAVPGAGLKVPVWLLGSSLFSAQLAGMLGLPFAFASHFAPDLLIQALAMYRDHFRPSETLQKPYAMAAANVVAAGTDEEARRLFTSQQQQFVNLRRGTPGLLPPAIDRIEDYAAPHELANVQRALARSYVGAPETVRRGLEGFLRETGVDELLVTGQIHDHAARLRSLELVAGLREGLALAA